MSQNGWGKNSASPEKSILVYDTFHTAGLDKIAIGNSLLAALKEKGFNVRITDRQEAPEVSERLLGEYSQFWVFFGESAPADISLMLSWRSFPGLLMTGRAC